MTIIAIVDNKAPMIQNQIRLMARGAENFFSAEIITVEPDLGHTSVGTPVSE